MFIDNVPSARVRNCLEFIHLRLLSHTEHLVSWGPINNNPYPRRMDLLRVTVKLQCLPAFRPHTTCLPLRGCSRLMAQPIDSAYVGVDLFPRHATGGRAGQRAMHGKMQCAMDTDRIKPSSALYGSSRHIRVGIISGLRVVEEGMEVSQKPDSSWKLGLRSSGWVDGDGYSVQIFDGSKSHRN